MIGQNNYIKSRPANAIDGRRLIVDGNTILPYKRPGIHPGSGIRRFNDHNGVFVGEYILPDVFDLFLSY
jgi:hypothetical protein